MAKYHMDIQHDYKRFCDEAPVGLYKTLQKDGTFLYINPYGARLLGFNSPADVIDKIKSSDLYDIKIRHKLIDALHISGKVSDFEIMITRPNGQTKWISATASNGDDYIIGSLTDITERKEMMHRLEVETAKSLGNIAEIAKARADVIAEEAKIVKEAAEEAKIVVAEAAEKAKIVVSIAVKEARVNAGQKW